MSNASDHPSHAPAAPAPRVRRTFGLHPNYLDIMCCLVLIFLLTSLLVDTSPRAREETLPSVNLAQLPEHAGDSAHTNAPPLVITVKAGPQYLLGNRPVTLADMPNAFRQTQPAEVEIRGDQAAQYGDIMNAMRICREAGISQVALTYQVKQ